MARRPTLKDISELANVSEMTASRVLRGKGEASAVTRERVLAAAKSVGYVPNRIAGSLSSKSVDLVGVVVPSISSFVFAEVLTGLSNVLKTTTMQPVFGVSDYDLETEETVIREMLSWQPKGLVVAGLEHTDAARKMMQNAGIPIVEIMDVDGDPVDLNVGVSHRRAGYETGKAILERGYKKLGFIGTKYPLDHRAAKRFEGFQKALGEAGVTLADQELYTGGSTLLLGRQLTEKLLERTPDLDMIYYSSDTMSCGGLMHCIMNNISVPDQLGLAGFNGLDLRHGMPMLTATMNAYRFEIGKRAAQLILEHEQSDYRAVRQVIEFKPDVELGDTL
ncbi:LacI family DNA-binding transcriptional regulator [Neptunicoccus sediminis]|uniref:LacI family DNA-binding transcriptional regulator n=1 Tax=Neptunicoccus sediminis TaxID=1892596 RepID=UPI0008461D9C|nr:LacI family DNA-binding transcriptional regulator [Neptunicoccus sediminis]